MMWQMWTAVSAGNHFFSSAVAQLNVSGIQFGIMMCAPNEHELLFDPLLMWFMAYSGTVCSLMFYDVSSPSIQGLNWRLMLGSGCVPPIIVFLQVIFLPESPRWLLEKGRVGPELPFLTERHGAHLSYFRLGKQSLPVAQTPPTVSAFTLCACLPARIADLPGNSSDIEAVRSP